MFLNILSKNEKSNFAKLLYVIAKVDGNFSQQEENQISAYLDEMGLTGSDINHENSDTESLIDSFSKSTDNVKKAIYMELIALVFADGEFSKNEKVVIKKIQENFTLSDQYSKEIIEWVKAITPLYHRGFQLAGLVDGGQ